MATMHKSQFTHGQRCTCKIHDIVIKDAKISVYENDGYHRVYICQDHQNGNDAKDKLGYKYSWVLLSSYTDEYRDGHNDVTELRLLPGEIQEVQEGDVVIDDNEDERRVFGRAGQIVFVSENDDEDDNDYEEFHIQTLIDNEWTIKQPTPETIEINGKKYNGEAVVERIKELEPIED